MKLKKFFAGVVAAAMMLTMGASVAFAADPETPADTAPTSGTALTTGSAVKVENGSWFTIKKTYKDAAKTAGLYADTVKLEADKSVAPTLSKNDHLKDADVASKTLNFTREGSVALDDENNLVGSFWVQLPRYEYVGEYTYAVKEAAGNTAGVDYNSASYKIVVLVTNKTKEEGGTGFNCYVSLRDANGTAGSKTDSIQNDFKSNTLTIGKTVEGNLGDKSEYFNFTVTLNAPAGKNVNNEITVRSEASKLEASIVNAAEGAKATYENAKIKFNGDSSVQIKFTLKHGETVNFENLPVGVTYTVSENDTTTDGNLTKHGSYTVTYEEGKGATGTINATAKSEAQIINTYGDNNVNTGVILDNAPYIALLAIVVFGGVALMLNKRRRDEE